MALSRISITIPRDLVAEADLLARELDRSRSWVVAEAVRRYLERGPDHRKTEPTVREVAPQPGYGLGPDEYRRAQLEADLRLTAEERVREAESTAALSELGRRESARQRLLVFETYEDYLAWQRWADIAPP
ncbi:MAG: ribbon-helix-helix protein, CopG family [Gemmatimonadetes bacterium]|nr:ribbon-helix-helix protein, CopG family [Gemmatimonadota bacterium]NIO32789.1 ribbon-helix-helix protein, CopG family [Gemmatimonadota bacterium]